MVWVFQLRLQLVYVFYALYSLGDILASSLCSPNRLGGCSPFYSQLHLGKPPLLAKQSVWVQLSFSLCCFLANSHCSPMQSEWLQFPSQRHLGYLPLPALQLKLVLFIIVSRLGFSSHYSPVAGSPFCLFGCLLARNIYCRRSRYSQCNFPSRCLGWLRYLCFSVGWSSCC